MSLTSEQINQAAADLFAAEQNGQQINILSLRFPNIDMGDAYAIQKELVALKINTGRHQIGWKIGLTSKAMQAALKIDIPDSGVLLDDMLFKSGDTVPAGRFIQPRVEAEIAFVMKTDLAGTDITPGKVLQATEYIVPALEILDTRIMRQDAKTGKSRTVFDTIADNAANAGIVLGTQKHAPKKNDLRWIGAILQRDGEVEETGLGAGVLNNPASGIAWLANRLSQYGDNIRAGDIVLSGSFIRPVEAPAKSKFHCDFGEFGLVEIGFG